MFSFGIMTVLLMTIAYVVHYDLLGLFPTYSHGQQHAHTTAGEHQHRREYGPMVDFDHEWLPKPGTDPNVHQHPGPIVLQMDDLDGIDDDDDDDDDFWSEVTDPNGDDTSDRAASHGGCSADDAGAKSTDNDTDTCPARGYSGFPTTDVPPPSNDDDEDLNTTDGDHDLDAYDEYDDFVAPGEEHDADVF
uniref:Uncharacterized protein n=1 Tax=Sipha flava TaxID=143950 RepID=A0A2S2PWM5_9HEMI